MTSSSAVDVATPQPLPSLPPSPTEEEDLSRANPAELEQPTASTSKSNKHVSAELYARVGSTDDAFEEVDPSYPPVNDEEAETRRVEENLRRWEMTERQRRKAARESATSTVSPSVVADVSRRASELLTGRSSKSVRRHPFKSHDHAVLQSLESVDVLPLDSLPASPSPSLQQDPFITPGETQDGNPNNNFPGRGRPPPPQPLDLPPPRTPPPRIEVSESAPSSPVRPQTPERETKWWHDWLCGCGGGDRAGDNQTGRTNPFE